MVFEGILIHKQIYKERDVIATFLLRNGDKISGYLYGGQGGGAKKKSDLLQIGYCLRFQGQKQGQGKGTLTSFKFSEWSIVWEHEKLRNHYSAFLFMTYLCELHEKIALPFDEEQVGSENEVLFKTLSNALFSLDQAPHEWEKLKILIFSKLIYGVGIYPDFNECCFCEADLAPIKSFLFVQEGKASCSQCTGEGRRDDGFWIPPFFARSLDNLLKTNFQKAFKKEDEFEILDGDVLEKYFWHHFQLRKDSFKSLTFGN